MAQQTATKVRNALLCQSVSAGRKVCHSVYQISVMYRSGAELAHLCLDFLNYLFLPLFCHTCILLVHCIQRIDPVQSRCYLSWVNTARLDSMRLSHRTKCQLEIQKSRDIHSMEKE